jgi:hypothetical protein
MFKLNATTRLLETNKIIASTQEEAGKLLTVLKPILGSDFKKSRRGNLEEIVWKNSIYRAGIELDIGDHLAFWFSADKDNFDLTVSCYSIEEIGVADDVIKKIKREVFNTSLNKLSPELQVILKKLRNIKDSSPATKSLKGKGLKRGQDKWLDLERNRTIS